MLTPHIMSWQLVSCSWLFCTRINITTSNSCWFVYLPPSPLLAFSSGFMLVYVFLLKNFVKPFRQTVLELFFIRETKHLLKQVKPVLIHRRPTPVKAQNQFIPTKKREEVGGKYLQIVSGNKWLNGGDKDCSPYWRNKEQLYLWY